MDSSDSSYYPPRAGRGRMSATSGVRFERLKNRFAHVMRRLPSPPAFGILSFRDGVLSVLVPGYAYVAMGRWQIGLIMAAVWILAMVLLLVFLANPTLRAWCLGTLASTHTSGLALAILRTRELDPDLPPPTVVHRIGLPLALWAIAAAVLYWPLDGLLNDTFARVVLVDGRNIIVNPRVEPEDLVRGDTILYRSEGTRRGGGEMQVLMRGGLYWGVVIGLPGDRIQFTTNGVVVAGRSRPPEAYMPMTGAVAIPRDTWFAWPRMLQRAAGAASPDVITQAFLDQAQITRAEFVGRPYRRWFFRRQETE